MVKKTTGDLFYYVRNNHNPFLTQPAFVELLNLPGFGFSNIKRYETGKKDGGGEMDDPILECVDLLKAVGRIAGMSPLQMLNWMGLSDVLSAIPLNVQNFDVSSFVEWPTKNDQIREAVETGIKARRLYSHMGSVKEARREFEKAIKTLRGIGSLESGILLLQAYFQMFAFNACEILGYLDKAGELIWTLRADVEKALQGDVTVEQDRIAKILLLRADNCELMLLLARGNYSKVIEADAQGKITSFEQRAMQLQDVYSMPRFQGLLARAHAATRKDREEAKHAAQEAAAIASRFAKQQYVDKRLFLDFIGEYGYERYIDFQFARQVDVLIDLGDIEAAYEVYREIFRQGRPSLHISLQNWFDPKWQSHLDILRKQFHPRDEDPKLTLEFADWVKDLQAGGQALTRAFVVRSYARLQRSLGNIEAATRFFEESMKISQQYGNLSLSIEAGLECCQEYILQNNRELALKVLDVIQANLGYSMETYFLDDYKRILEALARLK